MASAVHLSVEDKDLEDAELWAVIDSAAAMHSSSKSRKALAVKPPILHQSVSPPPNPFQTPRFSKYSRKLGDLEQPDGGEVLQENRIQCRPSKIARYGGPATGAENRMVVFKQVQQRTPKTPTCSYMSPDSGRCSVQEMMSPVSECSPFGVRGGWDDKERLSLYSSPGGLPSVPLFKEYQSCAMAILEKSDYTLISGNPYIKKSGWRKLSCYFNISYEIKDKSIEFDENRNVQRAEFVVRAYMQCGRFSDGWGSCDRREKRFMKPNHDIPSTAETRAKNKACQDLLGIGEFRPTVANAHH
ncbi:hypothetical protein Syun_002637 [Stephania yunnanensis]|uniref:Uncharacterized protein n=1 Tax=Stephania yunnanensis TaxID=152371 RepID=A0AAP0Q7C3_9MAGN